MTMIVDEALLIQCTHDDEDDDDQVTTELEFINDVLFHLIVKESCRYQDFKDTNISTLHFFYIFE